GVRRPVRLAAVVAAPATATRRRSRRPARRPSPRRLGRGRRQGPARARRRPLPRLAPPQPRAVRQGREGRGRRELNKGELDRLYAEHLDAVEAVQKQLDAILRQLAARRRGLPVYVEGLTDEGVNVFKLKATALSDVGAEQIPEARRSLA